MFFFFFFSGVQLAVLGGSLLGTFLSEKVNIELLTYHSLADTDPL